MTSRFRASELGARLIHGQSANYAVYSARCNSQVAIRKFLPEVRRFGTGLAMSEGAMVIGRLAGVDYGTKRIGIAISDVEQRIAVPATTLPGTGNVKRDSKVVANWMIANEAHGVVIGMPFNMDGTIGPQAELTKRFAGEMSVALPGLAVVTWDERLSSFQADEWLESAGQPKARGKRNPLRDALAATAILRSYLANRHERRDGATKAEV